jgi:hypothetical protein
MVVKQTTGKGKKGSPPRATRRPAKPSAMARVGEVARYFNVGRTTIHHWLRLGLLAYVNLPGQGNSKSEMRRIPWTAVEAFAQRYQGTAQTAARKGGEDAS